MGFIHSADPLSVFLLVRCSLKSSLVLLFAARFLDPSRTFSLRIRVFESVHLRPRIFPESCINARVRAELYLLPCRIRISLSLIGNGIRTATAQKLAISVIGKPYSTTREIGESRADRNLETANWRMKLHLSFSSPAASSHFSAHPTVLFARIITFLFLFFFTMRKPPLSLKLIIR